MIGAFKLNGIGKATLTASITKIKKYAKGYVNYSVTGSTSAGQSKFGGRSIYLDGSQDHISVFPSPEFNFTGNFTVECWIYYTAHANYAGIFSCANEWSNWAYGWQLIFNNAANSLFLEIQGSTAAASTATMTANTWNHVALVRNGTAVNVYLNGTSIISITNSTSFTDGMNPLVFGIERTHGAAVTGYFDEIRVSNVARYTSNFTAPSAAFTNDDNTILLLHGDEVAGTSLFNDESSTTTYEEKTITCFGGALTNSISKFGSTCFGTTNGAAMMGSGMFVPMVNGFANGENWTLEGWFRFTSFSLNPVMFRLGKEYYGRYVIFCDTGGTPKADKYSSGFGNFTASSALSLNTWYHIAAVKNSGTLTFYVNGTATGSSTNITGGGEHVGSWHCGGILQVGYDFAGYIDEVRISNIARYTSNFTAPTTTFTADNNTLALLHCEGSNGDRYFLSDVGRFRKISKPQNSASILSTQSKFGSYSLNFANNLSSVKGAENLSQSSNFTFEGWIYLPSTSSYNNMFNIGDESSGRWALGVNAGKIYANLYGSGDKITGSTTVTTNVWHHLAFTRSGSTVTAWLDGVSQGTYTHSGIFGNSNGWSLGPFNSGSGYIDEIRISNISRYSSNFTPSASAFTHDLNTVMLLHCNLWSNSANIVDDNGSVWMA